MLVNRHQHQNRLDLVILVCLQPFYGVLIHGALDLSWFKISHVYGLVWCSVFSLFPCPVVHPLTPFGLSNLKESSKNEDKVRDILVCNYILLVCVGSRNLVPAFSVLLCCFRSVSCHQQRKTSAAMEGVCECVMDGGRKGGRDGEGEVTREMWNEPCVRLSSVCMCIGKSSCRGPGCRLSGAHLSIGSRKDSKHTHTLML